MPTGKLYRNGLTLGMGGNPNPVGGKRGQVEGWSVNAVRRHTRWLYAVDSTRLDGHGWSLTLTLRDCPPTPEAWGVLRKRYLQRIRDTGAMVRLHWVTEWTRRKVPHMHLAIYLEPDLSPAQAHRLLIAPWLDLAAEYGVGPKGQHLAPITGAVGWLEYLSKHAARGVAHYQRSGKPPGWETTGRLWGHAGSWPVDEPAEITLTRAEFFRFRRLVRAWRIADARRELVEAADPAARQKAVRRLVSARHMLRCDDPTLSQVRGCSEWIPEDLGMVLLEAVAGDPGGAARAPGPRGRRTRPRMTVEDF